MKPRKKSYKPRHASVPMLVNRMLEANVETLQENSMVVAFQFGVATKQNYDYLVRMANMLNVAQQTKPSDYALSLVTHINFLAKEITDRYNAHGKFGLSGANLKLMRDLVNSYDEYWKRQTTTFYNNCAAEVNAFYADLEQNKVAA